MKITPHKVNVVFFTYLFVAVVVVFVALRSTGNGQDEVVTPKEPMDSISATKSVDISPIDVDTMTTEAWLNIFSLIPPGISYETTRRIFPTIGEHKGEAGYPLNPGARLSEVNLDVRVFEHDAVLQFNYEHDRLYNYYFKMLGSDSAAAERVFDSLTSFYSAKHGKYDQESSEEYYYGLHRWWPEGASCIIAIYSSQKTNVGWSGK